MCCSQMTLERTCQSYCSDLNQILQNNKDLQVLFIDGSKMYPHMSKMAVTCHLEEDYKLLYISNLLTNFAEICYSDTQRALGL